MPGLLTLKTDLKSLKYGQDTPGGGDSGQPYIKTDINTVDRGFNRFRLTRFDDGLVRGGVIGATNSSIVDTLRIGKFLVDFPKGPLFLIKQVGLQLSNPRLESKQVRTDRATRGGGFINNSLNFLANVAGRIENAVGPTRIYNLGINTLAQIPVNAVGGHIVRHGFLPVQDPSKYYEAVVKANNENNTNRLVELTNAFSLGAATGSDARNLRESNRFRNLGRNLTIDSYIGGPGSVYGIGTTLIRRFTNTNPSAVIYDYSFSTVALVNGQRQAFAYIDPSTFNGAISSDLGQRNKFSQWNKTRYIGGVEYQNKGLSDVFYGTITDPNELAKGVDQSVYNGNYAVPSSSVPINNSIAAANARIRNNDLFYYGASEYSSSVFAPTGSSLTDKSGIPNSLEYRIAADKDKSDINAVRQKTSYTAANTRIRNKDSFYYGASEYSSSVFAPTGSSLTNKSSIANSLEYRIASSKDKQHTRDSTLPQIENKNDIVSKGPSSYLPSGSRTTGLNSLSLPNLIYGVGSSTWANVKKATESRTAPKKRGIYTTILSANQLSANPNGVLPKSTFNPTYKNGYGKVVKINQSWNIVTRELRVGSGRQDSINLTPIFRSKPGTHNDTVKINGVERNINDLVKFRIQAINTDNPDEFAGWMIFRAYLTELSDDVNATWNPVKYAGRGDKFYIYDGFERKMSVSFKVAALSLEEMAPMYQKLNFLMSNLMPDYGSDRVMRGPLMRMTIGNYIDGQLCKLDTLTYKTVQDSPWEISIDENVSGPSNTVKPQVLPHIIDVTLGFTPIGSQTNNVNVLPQKDTITSHIAQNWNEPGYITGYKDQMVWDETTGKWL